MFLRWNGTQETHTQPYKATVLASLAVDGVHRVYNQLLVRAFRWHEANASEGSEGLYYNPIMQPRTVQPGNNTGEYALRSTGDDYTKRTNHVDYYRHYGRCTGSVATVAYILELKGETARAVELRSRLFDHMLNACKWRPDNTGWVTNPTYQYNHAADPDRANHARWESWGPLESETGSMQFFYDLGLSEMVQGFVRAYGLMRENLKAELSSADFTLLQDEMVFQISQLHYALTTLESGGQTWQNFWQASPLQNHMYHAIGAMLGGCAVMLADPSLSLTNKAKLELIEQTCLPYARSLQFVANGIGDGTWHEGWSYSRYGWTSYIDMMMIYKAYRGLDLLPSKWMRGLATWFVANHVNANADAGTGGTCLQLSQRANHEEHYLHTNYFLAYASRVLWYTHQREMRWVIDQYFERATNGTLSDLHFEKDGSDPAINNVPVIETGNSMESETVLLLPITLHTALKPTQNTFFFPDQQTTIWRARYGIRPSKDESGVRYTDDLAIMGSFLGLVGQSPITQFSRGQNGAGLNDPLLSYGMQTRWQTSVGSGTQVQKKDTQLNAGHDHPDTGQVTMFYGSDFIVPEKESYTRKLVSDHNVIGVYSRYAATSGTGTPERAKEENDVAAMTMVAARQMCYTHYSTHTNHEFFRGITGRVTERCETETGWRFVRADLTPAYQYMHGAKLATLLNGFAQSPVSGFTPFSDPNVVQAAQVKLDLVERSVAFGKDDTVIVVDEVRVSSDTGYSAPSLTYRWHSVNPITTTGDWKVLGNNTHAAYYRSFVWGGTNATVTDVSGGRNESYTELKLDAAHGETVRVVHYFRLGAVGASSFPTVAVTTVSGGTVIKVDEGSRMERIGFNASTNSGMYTANNYTSDASFYAVDIKSEGGNYNATSLTVHNGTLILYNNGTEASQHTKWYFDSNLPASSFSLEVNQSTGTATVWSDSDIVFRVKTGAMCVTVQSNRSVYDVIRDHDYLHVQLGDAITGIARWRTGSGLWIAPIATVNG